MIPANIEGQYLVWDGTQWVIGTSSTYLGETNLNLGAYALDSLPLSGSYTNNTAVGNSSLTALTSGQENTALGYRSGVSLASGNYNTIIGSNAGTNTAGDHNTILGYFTDTYGNNGSVLLGSNNTSTANYENVIGYSTSGAGTNTTVIKSLKDRDGTGPIIPDAAYSNYVHYNTSNHEVSYIPEVVYPITSPYALPAGASNQQLTIVNHASRPLRYAPYPGNFLGTSGGTDTTVYAMDNDYNTGAADIFIGGAFTIAGPSGAGVGRICRVSPDGLTIVSTLDDGFDDTVYTIFYDGVNGGNPRIYAGGSFINNFFGTTTLNRISYYDTGAGSWSTMGSNFGSFPTYIGLDATVRAITKNTAGPLSPNDWLVAGGDFTAGVGSGTIYNKIAYYNPLNDVFEPFSGLPYGVSANAVAYSAVIYATYITPTYIYVGGSFKYVAGGVEANNIARYNISTGQWSALIDSVKLGNGTSNGEVRAITGDPANPENLYIGGTFLYTGGFDYYLNQYTGVPCNNIAYWDNSISKWYPLQDTTITQNQGTETTVYAITTRANFVFVGGNFTYVAAASIDPANPAGSSVAAYYIAVFQTTSNAYTGEWFPVYFSAGTPSIPPSQCGFNTTVYALEFNSNFQYLIAGGAFTSFDDGNGTNFPMSYISYYDISGFSPTWTIMGNGTASGGALDNTVLALAVYQASNVVYAGGNFITDNDTGFLLYNIASYQLGSMSWSQMDSVTPGTQATGNVTALTFDLGTNTLWVGGAFSQMGPFFVNNMAEWIVGSGWVNTTFGSGVGGGTSSAVNALYVKPGTPPLLVIGGAFTSIVDFNGFSTSVNNMTFASSPSGTTTWNQAPYVGGGPGFIGPGDYVKTLCYATATGHLFVGGQLSAVNGLTGINNIIKWTGTYNDGFWSPILYFLPPPSISYSTPGEYGVNDIVNTIETDGNQIFVGGQFVKTGSTALGTTGLNYVGVLQPNNQYTWTQILSPTPPGMGVNAPVYSLSYDATSSKILVGGSFTDTGISPTLPLAGIASFTQNINVFTQVIDTSYYGVTGGTATVYAVLQSFYNSFMYRYLGGDFLTTTPTTTTTLNNMAVILPAYGPLTVTGSFSDPISGGNIASFIMNYYDETTHLIYDTADSVWLLANGPASAPIPNGTYWSNYLYWNDITDKWTVGGVTINDGVRIGYNSGQFGQGNSSIAIGTEAGNTQQLQNSIAIGTQAGYSYQLYDSVAIGIYAGRLRQSNNSVALGSYSGQNSQGSRSIAIGYVTAQESQGNDSIAIGSQAAQYYQKNRSIAIGYQAGFWEQASHSIAIGLQAGYTGQRSNSVAIGYTAGNINQGAYCVALGLGAGIQDQGQLSIAIGYQAGYWQQGSLSIAIGYQAGYWTQASQSIAIGFQAGVSGQQLQAIAIGYQAGSTRQGTASVAIGYQAGAITQSSNAVAVGYRAGYFSQQTQAVAIGYQAGSSRQGTASVAIGYQAGAYTQSSQAVAIGFQAGSSQQGTSSVAIGYQAGAITQSANAVAVGFQAGNFSQQTQAIAIGYQAGQTFQGTSSVAIGYQAGAVTQSANAVAVGYQAGNFSQQTQAIAIGYQAGQTIQGTQSIAIGYQAGQTYQGTQAIAIGFQAGQSNQGSRSIAIGYQAGYRSQGTQAIAIGDSAASGVNPLFLQGARTIAIGVNAGAGGQQTSAIAIGVNAAGSSIQQQEAVAIGISAGQNFQGQYAVALGSSSGVNLQGNYSVAVGNSAGFQSQGQQSVAVGYFSANNSQGQYAVVVGAQAAINSQGEGAVAIGWQAGQSLQGTYSVAIGYQSGKNTQSRFAVAVGFQSGLNSQGTQAVAIGYQAGSSQQGTSSVAIGAFAGGTQQGLQSVAIGYQAGQNSQANVAVAIGSGAGFGTQSVQAIAIGYFAGGSTQGAFAVAIGGNAGGLTQGSGAIAVGSGAGQFGQQTGAVAIGVFAGNTAQGTNSIAIGSSAGLTNQHQNSIIINATGSTLNSQTQSAFYAAPIRQASAANTLYYDTTFKEIVYEGAAAIQAISLSNFGQTSKLSSIPYSSNQQIRTSHIEARLDNFTDNGQTYTFGPTVQAKYVAATNNATGYNTYSFDGINWIRPNSQVFGASGPAHSVAYNGNLWVMGGQAATGAATTNPNGGSISGTTFSITSISTGATFYPGALLIGSTIAAGTYITAQLTGTPGGIGTYSVNISQTVVAGAFTITGQNTAMAYSYDGITWNGGYGFYPATVSVNGICYGVAWGKDKFVAVGTNGNATTPTIVYYSYDGINWTAGSGITGAAGGSGRSVAYNGTRWVMVGAIGATAPAATAWYSADGINWTATTTNVFTNTNFAIGYGIAWNGLLWVAVGTNSSNTSTSNTINYSTDGLTWTVASTSGSSFNGFGGIGFCVAWNGIRWVAGGTNGLVPSQTILYSTNGINWTGTSPEYAVATAGTGGVSSSTLTVSGITSGAIRIGMSINITTATVNTYITAFGTGTGGTGTYIMSQALTITAGTTVTFDIQNANILTNTFSGSLGQCRSLNWNGTKWLAGGTNGSSSTIFGAYSYDGITWTTLTSTQTGAASINGIGYNSARPNTITFPRNILVAGGSYASGATTLAYSINDGSSWTACTNQIFGTTGGSSYCYSVATNGIMWVAGGAGTATLGYSFDGIVWTAVINSTSIFSTNVKGIAWSPVLKLWVAVGAGTNQLAYSYDGINWVGVTLPSGGFSNSVGFDVSWGKDKFVACGGNTNVNAQKIFYSLNGISWTLVTSSTFTVGAYASGFNGTVWVSVGSNGASAAFPYYSYDGITWSVGAGASFSTNDTIGKGGVAWNGYRWVVVTGTTSSGVTSTPILYSADGINWTAASVSNNSVACVVWSGNRFVAGYYIPAVSTQIFTSPDGITWTVNAANTFGSECNNIAWSAYQPNSGYQLTNVAIQQPTLALGTGTNNTIAYSYDGIQWRGLGTTIFRTSGQGACWNGKIWVAGGISSGAGVLAYSYDGINWTIATQSIFTSAVYSIAWNGTVFVAAGQGTTTVLAYSYDGVNWTSSATRSSVAMSLARNVTWGQKYFVAVGATSTFSVVGGFAATGTTVTITSSNETLAIGQLLTLTGVGAVAGTYITGQLTGTTGGVGTYTVNVSNPIGVSVTNATYGYYNAATFTGSISATTLTVSAVTGTVSIGQLVYGGTVTANTYITAGSGSTWTVSISQTSTATGSAGGGAAYSTDGINWTGVTSAYVYYGGGYNSVIFAENRWIIYSSIGSATYVLYASSLTTSNPWTFVLIVASTSSPYGITYGTYPVSSSAAGTTYGTVLVIGGSNSSGLGYHYSINGGTSWSGITTAATQCVAWNGKKFLLGSQTASDIKYATNPTVSTNFVSATNPTGAQLFTTSINAFGVSDWPTLGSVYVDNALTISGSSGLNTNNQLDIYSDTYFNNGYNNMSVTVKSTQIP